MRWGISMQPRTHFTIWNWVVVIIVMMLLQTYLFAPRQDHIAYSQFEELIQKGQVKEVMSFGKNKAKLYAQETGITFNDIGLGPVKSRSL